MSAEARDWVRANGPQDHVPYIVLYAVADVVNPENDWQFWDTATSIATGWRLSVGAVRRALTMLADNGWLERVAEPDSTVRARSGGPVRYRLPFVTGAPFPPRMSGAGRAAGTSRPPRAPGSPRADSAGTLTPQRGVPRADETGSPRADGAGTPRPGSRDPAPTARDNRKTEEITEKGITNSLPGLSAGEDVRARAKQPRPSKIDPAVDALARREWESRDVKPCGGNFVAFRQQIDRQVNRAGASIEDVARLIRGMNVFSDASFDLARARSRPATSGPRSRADGWSRDIPAGKVEL